MTDVVALRSEIRSLHEQKRRGDIPERKFERRIVESEVSLLRAVARGMLEDGEEILADHHVVHAHMKLNESVLEEPEQEAVSLFLTDRRLVRIRATIVRGRPLSCSSEDGTRIDEVPLSRVRGVRIRREYRTGEMIAGAVIIVLAIAFRSLLLVTGTILAILGGLGVLHALVLPTRWAEVVVGPGGMPPGEEFAIHGLRKKSSRALVKRLGRSDGR